MAKFVDKQNLPQYKYFNNLIGKVDVISEIVSDCLAGEYQLSNHHVKSDPKEYRESLMRLNKGKRDLVTLLYVSEEDRERCRRELFSGNVRQAKRNTDRYLNMLMAVPYLQGEQLKRKTEVSAEILAGLSEKEKNQKYELDRKDGKYYSSFFSVPKLVLVNGDLFARYLDREMTEKDIRLLDSMLPEDVHYILNAQHETQNDHVYLIAKDEGVYMKRLDRHGLIQKKRPDDGKGMEPEMVSAMLCLTDYLKEMKEQAGLKAGKPEEAGKGSAYDANKRRISKYIDRDSIKVFDMETGGAGGRELEVNYFKKKHGGRGTDRVTGYEMAPHTRRGHYRRCKNGKTVYVRSTVVHKEKYDGIRSARRINGAAENGGAEENMERPAFTMGM